MRMPPRPPKDDIETRNENGLNIKGLLAIFCIAAIVAFGVVWFFMTGSDDESKKAVAPAVVQEKSSPAETPAPVKKDDNVEQKNYYTDGQYKVGTDIPAGEYLAIGTGYIELAADSSGKNSSIIFNDNINEAQRYIEARDGEYLKISGRLKLYQEKDAPKLDTSNKVPAGQYKVGLDIPAGEYKVTTDGNGLTLITKTSRGYRGDNTASSKRLQNAGSFYVTVENGQYLQLKNSEAQLVK